MRRGLAHFTVALALTLLTQIGGLAWLFALAFRRRFVVFGGAYAALWLACAATAPMLGRVALPCAQSGILHSQSILYCALNRHYVTPEMASVASDLATQVNTIHPGTITQTLDGSFPFLTGFPLLPHLSHDDGEKLDIAFYWQDETGTYAPGRNKSFIGYWGYAQGPTNCPDTWRDLRWDFIRINSLLPDLQPDPPRLRTALRFLSADPRVSKILVEPHIVRSLDVSDPKIRFQGCRAARHDDHIHIQL